MNIISYHILYFISTAIYLNKMIFHTKIEFDCPFFYHIHALVERRKKINGAKHKHTHVHTQNASETKNYII